MIIRINLETDVMLVAYTGDSDPYRWELGIQVGVAYRAYREPSIYRVHNAISYSTNRGSRHAPTIISDAFIRKSNSDSL